MLDAAYTYRNPYHQTNTWTNFLYHNKILAKNRELSRANFEALGILTLLISFPIVSIISSLIMATVFQVDISEMTTKSMGMVFLFIFFGVVFGIYSFFSKPFNLQYLNRVKN